MCEQCEALREQLNATVRDLMQARQHTEHMLATIINLYNAIRGEQNSAELMEWINERKGV